MTEIQGNGGHSISPREKKLYKNEYVQGAQLFQKALQQYTKSDNPFQREEFRQVMDQAMNVLNETARELKTDSLKTQNEKIAKDYTAFMNQPADETKVNALNQDLEKAKHLI
jgi:hypothetical protein